MIRFPQSLFNRGVNIYALIRGNQRQARVLSRSPVDMATGAGGRRQRA